MQPSLPFHFETTLHSLLRLLGRKKELECQTDWIDFGGGRWEGLAAAAAAASNSFTGCCHHHMLKNGAICGMDRSPRVILGYVLTL